MTGEWKEFKSDCEGIKNMKQKQMCEARFILEEDCEKTYGTEADEKKRKDLIKKCENKKKAKVKKASKGGDCSKYMSKLSKEKKDLISKIKGFISSKVADYDGQVKGDNLTDKEDGFVNGMKIRLTGKMSEEDKKSVIEYNKFIMTAAYKSALSNSIKCNNKNKESAGEEISKVEIDSVSGEEYIRTSDSAFMTPAKSCLQYEESLKATRNAWKAKAVEAIAENSRNIANRLKREEAKQLAADLKVNMEIASMANKVFSACLGEMRSCMTKDNLCGKDYKDCVDENGLRKDKLLPAGIECYAPFKTCMETTSKTLNIKNMSPQLQEIVKGIQQDPDKLSSMAIDSIGESLGNTFNKLMETECKKAGGFFYDGLCLIGFLSSKDSSWATDYSANASRTNREYYYWWWWPWSSDSRDSASVSGKNGKKEHSTKYGVALPGVQMNCSKDVQSSSESNSSSTIGNASANSGHNGQSYAMSSADVNCGGDHHGDGAYGSARGNIESRVTTTASASCSFNQDILLLFQKNNELEVKPKEQSCGFLFAPKGPWSEFMMPCVKNSERLIFPSDKKDALSVAIDKFSEPTRKGTQIDWSYKDSDGLRRYKLTIISSVKRAERWYIENYSLNRDNDGREMRAPKNPNSKIKEFNMSEKEDNNWKLVSERVSFSKDVCKPKAWLIGKEFPEVYKRWVVQFK